mmetsp:Transcript_102127/g.197707  ORF Transcript_102127/g.197707 Transcript_102127/m.197707 type:complete len:287 (+) Transcript_102127:1-861(+)
MTPVISYWSDDNMMWLDGKGFQGKGACSKDDAASCPETVRFYDFEVEDFRGSCEICPVGSCERTPQGTCMWFQGKWLKSHASYHCQVTDCASIPVGSQYSECWEWNGGKKYYSIMDQLHACKEAPVQQPLPTVKPPAVYPHQAIPNTAGGAHPHGYIRHGDSISRPAHENSGGTSAQVCVFVVLVLLAIGAASYLGWQWFQKEENAAPVKEWWLQLRQRVENTEVYQQSSHFIQQHNPGWQCLQNQQNATMDKDSELSYTQVRPLANSSDRSSHPGLLCCITTSST